ncbi:DHH family phosphoesterase [Corynebacterium ulcerans]|uniref:DHH subfamily 1 protein n=1 Tax=Corynebacterium ulcerans TaxID=65058 RepID=A0ABD7MRH3_CORUL|nr:bifunctional oligoribonuclease/PAP phosphatase NrnA [Corynebacterium ulcerans]QQU25320.1 bifunctional oligoribonuclease/PAP phosphatase NrnA [Corynebacterium ulcerans]SNV04705.1 DHH subfamily 1 protein [Corynebacterium ulcerans]SQG50354.1 DHH subfamily 1 protein [Corynebacterium ulcerans]SQH01709.1 DHH subfamily 1 protein [Corynebacterium ulcerans]
MNKTRVQTSSDKSLDWSAAERIISKAKRVCVVGHINPDPDAIGSVCATMLALEQLSKEVIGVIGQCTPLERSLLDIPRATDILTVDRLPECDAIIAVDCGAVGRLGALQPQVMRDISRVILIDHHSTNRGFAGVNLIDHQAESTTSILRDWFQHLKITLTKDIAYGLYAGLVSDTGGFRWGRPEMHALAQELVDTGLEIRAIGQQLFSSDSVADLAMIGTILSRLQVVYVNNISVVVAIARYDDVQGHSAQSVEKIADLIRGSDGTDIAVVFKEYKRGEWAVSLRSEDLDISVVARTLGGGGHIRSSGYVTFGTVDHVVAELKAAVQRTC